MHQLGWTAKYVNGHTVSEVSYVVKQKCRTVLFRIGLCVPAGLLTNLRATTGYRTAHSVPGASGGARRLRPAGGFPSVAHIGEQQERRLIPALR